MSGQGGWVKVVVEVPHGHLDAASGLLWELGASGVEIHDGTTMDRVDGATRAVAYFGGEPVEALELRVAAQVPELWTAKVSVKPFTDESWKENWKQFFKPMQASRRLGVRPPWEARPDWPEEVCELVIEPGLAFGTGTHATTLLCLGYLDDLLAQDRAETLLDVGCGSGILSIAAAKLSPGVAIRCLDVDPEARRVSRENCVDNGVADAVTVLDGLLDAGTGTAGLVVANILAHILLRLREDLARATAPGGRLLLSGIGAKDEDKLRVAFSELLTYQERRERDGWVALLFSRPSA